ncbi:MAG: hypothetical protein U9R34_03860 [Nanoarchaeota archaeon]|nr:hypothetical protein [Nanoarchaeota archaeon]
MKRKVSKIGPSTLMISLPNKWVKKYDINKGDELDIEEREKGLLIGCKKEVQFGQTKVTIHSGDHFMRRFIDTPYRIGYDEFIVNYDDPLIFEKIQNEVGNLMGFEIVEQGENYCKVKNIAKGLESEFDVILNRLFIVTITMFKDLREALKKHELERLPNIEKMENMNNRLTHFCKRMLNIQGYSDERKTRSIYRIVCLFEEIGDQGRDICRYIMKNNLKIDKRYVELLNDSISQMKLFYKLFNHYESEKLFEFGKKEKIYEKKGDELFLKLEKHHGFLIHCILNIFDKTKHMTEELS